MALISWLAYAAIGLCLALLTAGLWPGRLAQIYGQLWNTAFAWLWILSPLLPFLALIVLVGLGIWLWRFPLRGPFPSRSVGAAALAIGLTAVLLSLRMPQRLGLLASRGALQQQLAAINRSQQQPQVDLQKQLGLYRVEHYSVDFTGEVYFQTATSDLPGLVPGQQRHGLLYSQRPERRTIDVNGLETAYLGDGWYLYTARADYFHRWNF